MIKIAYFTLLGAIALMGAENRLSPELQKHYFQKKEIRTENDKWLEQVIISGPPVPPKGFKRSTVDTDEIKYTTRGSTKIISTPAFSWSFGCSATSAAMIAGYYDRNGYPDIYTGPTNGGVMPLDNSVWPDWTDNSGAVRHQCPLSATHKGLDGRTEKGHVDDYWVQYNDQGEDPYQTNGWSQHTHSMCTGDFMKTNQAFNYYESSQYGNRDGATTFYYWSEGEPLTAEKMEQLGVQDQDGAYGFKRFMESRGYEVTTLYTQLINPYVAGGFTFEQYKAEIDASHPVLIHVKGHTMEGVGYDDGTDKKVYVHDTWDYDMHSFVWGESYSGMEQWGVSVLHLKKPEAPVKTFAPVYYLLEE